MRYVAKAIVAVTEGGHNVVEVRRDAYDRYNAELDAAMAKMLWEREKGGGGYYVNQFGRSGVNMPWTLADFHRRTETPNPDDFRFS